MTDWADVLTDKLLKEEPQDKPLREIMADALRNERKRCAWLAARNKHDDAGRIIWEAIEKDNL